MKKMTVAILITAVAVLLALGGYQLNTFTRGGRTQLVLAGESFVSGADAIQKANTIIKNAAACGCRAISVGGYGAADAGMVVGVPVLLDCPSGTTLLPIGTCQ
jgi:hypothetical protein